MQLKMKIATLGIKTQQLIAKCYDLHLLEEARLFRKVDAGLWEIYGGLKEPQGRQGAKSKEGEYLEVLEVIYVGMLRAEKAARDAADTHMHVFLTQITGKIGIFPNITEEPYLEAEVHCFELQLLKTLERLALRMERLYQGKKCIDVDSEFKKIDPKQPVLHQVIDQVAYEENHMQGRMHRRLDYYRQQQAGIHYYIWRSQDDDKVRHRHAENDDKLFAWGNPPEGGHPGEAYNCRCWAEPSIYGMGEPKIQVAFVGPIIRLISQGSKIIAKQKRKVEKLKERLKKPKPNIFKRPKDVPEDWTRKPAEKGDGVKYIDPKSTHNYIRISRGKPNSSNPGQRTDYVRWQKNGQSLDKKGNPVRAQSKESHIPMEEFTFKPELFK